MFNDYMRKRRKAGIPDDFVMLEKDDPRLNSPSELDKIVKLQTEWADHAAR
jgi:hypothetical protein